MNIIVSGIFILVGFASMGYGAENDPDITQASASIQTITEWYEAVGTVRPLTETSIAAQIAGQVVQVNVRPGNKVKKNDVLLTIDDRQFKSRLDQARQGLKTAVAGKEQARQSINAAEAAFKQAESNYNRVRKLFNAQAATSQQLEQAESAYLQAKAQVSKAKEALAGAEAGIRQAQEIVNEAEIALGYSKIVAPESGEVLKRLVEPGDFAAPGRPLIVLQTEGALRLEAYVREGLIDKVKVGDILSVTIGVHEKEHEARVEEIVPYADPETRTFLVKANLPKIEGLYPGMYGKLMIPVKEIEVVVIPETAIRKVGQLELVDVKEKDGWKTLFIKTGQRIGNHQIEVLSGLNGDETIGIKESK